MINAYQYVKRIARVRTVYGETLRIDADALDTPERTLLPICNASGLKRTHTKAGKDGMNALHRGNIAEVISIKPVDHDTPAKDQPCQHPPTRLFSWYANGTLCVCCCECGSVLHGGVE